MTALRHQPGRHLKNFGWHCYRSTALNTDSTVITMIIGLPLLRSLRRGSTALGKERCPALDFVGDLGITTWSQFFLKWVISHPAVTCALPATTNPEHMNENLEAIRGPRPDHAMREKMVRYMDTVPGFQQLDRMPRYPGKSFNGLVRLRS